MESNVKAFLSPRPPIASAPTELVLFVATAGNWLFQRPLRGRFAGILWPEKRWVVWPEKPWKLSLLWHAEVAYMCCRAEFFSPPNSHGSHQKSSFWPSTTETPERFLNMSMIYTFIKHIKNMFVYKDVWRLLYMVGVSTSFGGKQSSNSWGGDEESLGSSFFAS